MAVAPVTLDYADPYKHGDVRPYLALHVVGINGAEGDVFGLIDTGADVTCMPRGYASLMGYTAADLERSIGGSASGSMTMWDANKPSTVWLPGLESQKFELWPSFVEGVN